ncbi:hypothetical protein VTK73DRAFT_4534 [Phialemonium thermophilum]|uniref:Uncharacterized protein n=1 Tax=Phialemonium thermophilum TaxID=223376 RepID=A0ABR3V7R7_9PEZI
MRSLAPSCRSARACLEMMEALDRHLAQQRQQQQQQQEHVQPYQQQTTSVGGNPEQQERGLETGRWSMPDFRSISPSVVLPDWAESFGLDELLLGRDFGFLQEGSQGL